ncbi:MAG: hypothetical protein AB2385_05200 [Symbiobacterium sp.]|jgi:hypothetical protein|uniref:hypothetical protein n=1 Tax=Symbiobacterium sp. TaxID=1971213 RepID=UPI0034646D9D
MANDRQDNEFAGTPEEVGLPLDESGRPLSEDGLPLDETGKPVEDDGVRRLPTWVYALLIGLLVLILLGVESVLNRLLP